MQDENARIFLRATVAKKQQLGLLGSGNPSFHPKKLIPILNRLLRLLPPCIQIIQVPIGRLHIVIIYTHSISNNTLSVYDTLNLPKKSVRIP